jgi:hypothetical protein
VLTDVGLDWRLPEPAMHYMHVCPRCRRCQVGVWQGRVMADGVARPTAGAHVHRDRSLTP